MPGPNKRVLVADSLDPDQLTPLRDRGIEVVDEAGIEPEELLSRIEPFHGLLVRSRTQVTEALLDAAPHLQVVGRAGTGVDNVDIAAATRAGVVVMNVPGGNAVAAAEHTIALMTSLARSIPQAAASLRAGRWDRKAYQGTELTGKTLGVIGLGRIGREVALRARGLRMHVLAYDPITSSGAAEDIGVGLRSLEDLVAESDFLTVHVPLGDATRHLIGRDLLSKAKPGLRVLNVARGGVVDEAALLEAIENGTIGGAAIDVFESEPPAADGIVAHPAVVATPHLGASTVEAQAGVACAIADQVAAYLVDGTIENAVNVVGIDPALRAEIGPWADLGRRLGAVASALSGDGIRRVDVTLMGEITAFPHEPLTTGVLMGVLGRFGGDRINPVNAALFASERGIRISTGTRTQHRSFQSLIRVSVEDEDGAAVAVDGVLFGTAQFRIVRAFDFNIDAIPEGPLLCVANEDRPGIIGHLGSILAEAGINIANMSVGRKASAGEALAILNLDGVPDQQTLSRLRSRPEIRWTRLVPSL